MARKPSFRTSRLLARSEAELTAKRERLGLADVSRGHAVTTVQAVDLVGADHDAGSQMFITSIFANDAETQDLLASEVIPHFANKFELT